VKWNTALRTSQLNLFNPLQKKRASRFGHKVWGRAKQIQVSLLFGKEFDAAMNWQKQLEESIDYIEAHVAGSNSTLDLQHLARIVHASDYHYQRIFSFMVGVPLGEYVRRRKMSLAGIELLGGTKVIDLAYKYGYESPNSFARAFKRVHGITPAEAKQEGSTLKTYPRIRFQITTTGDTEMEYRIEGKSGFRVIGLTRDFSQSTDLASREEIAGFWYEAAQGGTLEKLASLSSEEAVNYMGVTVGHDSTSSSKNTNGNNASDITHYISVLSDKEVPAGFAEYEVPAQTWAIFPISGEFSETSNPLADTHKYVFTEWLPNSGYVIAEGLDIEVWPAAGMKPPHFDLELWLPVKKLS
jgi:AraC family transcriptional regulator